MALQPCRFCHNLTAAEFCSDECYDAYTQETGDDAPRCEDLACPECGSMEYPCECGADDEPYDMTDVEADADTLAGAGWGTDEDYGFFDSASDW